MSYTTTLRPVRRNPWPLFLGLMLLFSAVYLLSYRQMEQGRRERMEMKKSRGRNESHANQKAREKAAEEHRKAKEELDQLEEKINKSKEDVELRRKLRKKVEHWRKKKDWRGEHHSQKHKGD